MPKQDDVVPVLLTVSEVATMLAVSERHVWDMTKEEVMPAPVHLGRATRWRRDDVENWIAAGCPRGLSDPLDASKLSIRTRNAIHSLGISTYGELCRLSEEEVADARNLGPGSLNELKQHLAERGLHLGCRQRTQD